MPVSIFAWPGAVAIGISLVIIALKSYSGFYKYTDVLESQNIELDWTI